MRMIQRRLSAVVLNSDLGKHRRVRSAGAQSCEVFPGDRNRLIHLVFGFEKDFVDHSELRLTRGLLRHMKLNRLQQTRT